MQDNAQYRKAAIANELFRQNLRYIVRKKRDEKICAVIDWLIIAATIVVIALALYGFAT